MRAGYYIENNRACFDSDLSCLPEYAFAGREDLHHAHIPGHIHTIGPRSFENCRNLETLTLEEGIEFIDMEAFLGCSGLRSVVIPNSAELTNYVFYGCDGLTEPVFSRDRTVLYAYPNQKKDTVYMVPEGTVSVNCTAFGKNPFLKEVIFPEGLRALHIRAFCDSLVKRVVLPCSVREITYGTFENCRELEELIVPGKLTRMEEKAFSGVPETLRIKRNLQLAPCVSSPASPFHWFEHISLPIYGSGKEDHSNDPVFRNLAEHCEKEDPDAMQEMAEFFWRLNDVRPHEFYLFSAAFWAHRAHLCRSGACVSMSTQWHNAHRNASVPNICSGKFLRYLGFLFFDPERIYLIYKYFSDTGILLVYSPCENSRDPNDKGTFHDWYFLSPELSLLSKEHQILHCTRWIPEEDPNQFLNAAKRAKQAVLSRSSETPFSV